MLKELWVACHVFLPDDRPAAHLAGMVSARVPDHGRPPGGAGGSFHGAKLATLDTGIPGAFIVPRPAGWTSSVDRCQADDAVVAGGRRAAAVAVAGREVEGAVGSGDDVTQAAEQAVEEPSR